jgi:hypothetical protein
VGGRWKREVKWYVIQNSAAIVTQLRLLAGQGVEDGEEPNLSLGKEGLERSSLFARLLYLPFAMILNHGNVVGRSRWWHIGFSTPLAVTAVTNQLC